MADWHHGRSWVGHPIEDACPCTQEACGLVGEASPECDQHGVLSMKTIRRSHLASECPGRTAA